TDPALVDLGLDLSSLTAISYRDVAFAFVAWASAPAGTLLAVRRACVARVRVVLAGARAGGEGTIVVLFMIGAALSCLYAIASVVAFGILGGFLTWALLQLVGNLRMLSSSVSAYLTRGVAAGLIGVPLAYGGL